MELPKLPDVDPTKLIGLFRSHEFITLTPGSQLVHACHKDCRKAGSATTPKAGDAPKAPDVPKDDKPPPKKEGAAEGAEKPTTPDDCKPKYYTDTIMDIRTRVKGLGLERARLVIVADIWYDGCSVTVGLRPGSGSYSGIFSDISFSVTIQSTTSGPDGESGCIKCCDACCCVFFVVEVAVSGLLTASEVFSASVLVCGKDGVPEIHS